MTDKRARQQAREERERRKARELMTRMIPLDEWIALTDPTADQIIMRERIMDELRRIAAGEVQSVVVIRGARPDLQREPVDQMGGRHGIRC